MKKITGFVAAAVMAIGLTAPALAQSTLKIGLAEDPDILDPTIARTYVGRLVFASLCDKLFDIDENLKIVPQLATGYQWTDENKSLTLKLRDGVVFHDGEKFDAAAVKYSLERHKNLQGSTRRGELASVASVEVVDPLTVKLNLSAPFTPLLAILTDRSGMIISPKAGEALGANFGTKPICTGPYKFVERVAQDRIVVEKFDQYWNKGQIFIDRVIYRPIYDNSVRLANLQSGDLDFIERLAATDAPEVRKNTKLKLETATELGYQGITINTNNGDRSKNPLGQDARVRQAFSLSLDREAINQVVFNGEYVPGSQWVPPTNAYFAKTSPVPKRDIAKAKALLKEAGIPNPSFTLMVSTAPDAAQVGQVIQSMAKEAGFDIKLQATEFASALKFADQGEMEAFLVAWSGRPDPDGNVHAFVTCKGPLNDGRYCNPKLDEAINGARAVGDLAERVKYYEQAAAIMEKELPIVYLYHRKLFFAHSTKVTGFKVMPDGMIRVQGLKLGS
jgi:peptide/nickel transport system substrate-binding protein